MTHPRTATVLGVAVLVTLTGEVPAIKPVPGPADKPPYQRLLQGDDVKRAAELQKRIAERAAADDYGGAIQAAAELLALRRRVQGADHHEALDAKWSLEAWQKVAALPAAERAAWRAAVKGEDEARQLEAQGRYA
jgi:hypothetical protein